MPFPNGANVRQVVPVITGKIEKKRLHEQADQLEYLVAWTDSQGQPQTKWFMEHELEEAK